MYLYNIADTSLNHLLQNYLSMIDMAGVFSWEMYIIGLSIKIKSVYRPMLLLALIMNFNLDIDTKSH